MSVSCPYYAESGLSVFSSLKRRGNLRTPEKIGVMEVHLTPEVESETSKRFPNVSAEEQLFIINFQQAELVSLKDPFVMVKGLQEGNLSKVMLPRASAYFSLEIQDF
eukprot:GHVU01180650.1.p1 GENE.GHVU01180650.1~~GHVU01180650.1.p1  ORF type:complete len:107 (-),score=16.24 GHVU01180650.1:675-995(-)